MEGEGVEWPVIGIDLGTTYSCAAIWRRNRVEIITNDQGNRTTPSWVAFTAAERLIGEAAMNQVAMNPTNTVFDAKRLIGRKFNDELVQNDIKLWPFKVTASSDFGEDQKPMISVTYKGEEKSFAPEEISAMVLMKMKDISEAFIGTEVKNAVVTVPAYFNNSQRQATKDAGTIAGLNVVRIINEPTAAAMAYGLDRRAFNSSGEKIRVLIFDFGGGTFDVSLVEISNGKFEVKAVSGNTHLGGGDFDTRLVNDLVEEFKRKHGRDIRGNNRALARLRAASERAKRALSSMCETTINIDCLSDGIDFCSTISRSRFEKLNMDLFTGCLDTIDKCLSDAGIQKSDIDDVVLVGGSTRIPKVQELLQEYFDGKELCKSINPDEAVACGAAFHAAVLSGVANDNDIVLVDVTPLSLGIEVRSGGMLVVVPRNSVIPAKMKETTVTAFDNQATAAFNVYEGERGLATENNFLGMFVLHDIPEAPEGSQMFEVIFDLNVDGILTVSAKHKGTDNMKKITITNCGRLPNTEIARMVREAEEMRAQDEEHIHKTKAKQALEKYCNRMLDLLNDDKHNNVLLALEHKMMRFAVQETLEWLEKIDADFEHTEPYELEYKLEELKLFFKSLSNMQLWSF